MDSNRGFNHQIAVSTWRIGDSPAKMGCKWGSSNQEWWCLEEGERLWLGEPWICSFI